MSLVIDFAGKQEPTYETADKLELFQLIRKLDTEEVKVVTEYVANLLLERAVELEPQVKGQYNGPRC